MSTEPQVKYLNDYQPPEFLISQTELIFTLSDSDTKVLSRLAMVRAEHTPVSAALSLDSQVEKINSIKINGQALSQSQYQVKEEQLVIDTDLAEFELEVEVVIDPLNNTELQGLYKSQGVFCTQCEAEGFRKITPFLDRPDVLSIYTVTIIADKNQYPSILSNGNPIDSGEQEGSQHWVTWQDPHPKPSYLFALVAGDFDCLTDEFITASGRKVSLELFVDKGNLPLSQHAMSALKKAMLWDEQKYGLEYDLDKYMIVAVDFFNMGAMENKGLNVFNSKCVLADEQTATDRDYEIIEAIIAHEYFHNWTGNRVTCRDWFQLSLKEGLTVFRDQQFSADMGSEVIERIRHANLMRTMQFEEDAGPMAHSIRPDKVMEMNNFYTVTVYDKGAEVIRMMHSLLAEDGFRKGMDLYFSRHDGQAVTCDDFVSAMADANGVDLNNFRNWYAQAGTPVVKVAEVQDTKQLTLTLSQGIPTQGKSAKTLVIPVKYELLSKTNGHSLKQGVLVFDQVKQEFQLPISEPVVLVLFENFSAPVKVERRLPLDDLKLIAESASDAFSRWDAIQQLWVSAITSNVDNASSSNNSEALSILVESLITLLNDSKIEMAVKAELLALPSFASIAEHFDAINVDSIFSAKQNVIGEILTASGDVILDAFYKVNKVNQSYDKGYEYKAVSARRLKQVLLEYLSYAKISGVHADTLADLLSQQFKSACNMTETMSVLDATREFSEALLNDFLNQLSEVYSDNTLVLDKLFSTVGKTNTDNIFEMMETWSQHSQFNIKNPNRVRALYGAFVMQNPAQFHHASGRGYEFLADLLIKLDAYNPQLASRMITPLLAWQRYDDNRQQKMKSQLQKLSKHKLSKDLFEKVDSALS